MLRSIEKRPAQMPCDEIIERVVEQIEIETKYAPFIERQAGQVAEFRRKERTLIPGDVDYDAVAHLSAEARERLARVRPRSVGQALRVAGVTPADVSILLVHLKQRDIA